MQGLKKDRTHKLHVFLQTIAGAADLKLVKQNTTSNATTTMMTDAPTTAAPPTTAASPPAPMTDSMPPLQQVQIHCPCPQRTCFTTITSTNNKHTITCGSNTFDVPCGGPLMVMTI